MNLFSVLYRKKINLKWEYRAISQIWRILIAENGFIIGEERNIQAKEVSFFCIHSGSGTTIWKEKKLSELWWIELGIVHRNVILLHEFASPDLPEHKKIIALDLLTGELRWENSDCQLLFPCEDSLFAAKNTPERRIFYELDSETGCVLREVDQSSLTVLQEDVVSKLTSTYSLPKKIDVNSEQEDALASILKQLKKKGGSSIEYAEYWSNDNFAVICYYSQSLSSRTEKKILEQRLEVFDLHSQKSLYTDELLPNAVAIVPDGFFYMNGMIVYIRTRNTLRAVQIAPLN
jgi:hypothetical protein